MSITNVSKPSSSYTNVDRTPVGETWATISTTWASETRTWEETGSFFDMVARVGSSSITNSTKPS